MPVGVRADTVIGGLIGHLAALIGLARIDRRRWKSDTRPGLV
jgi:hypothetical protein